MVKSSMTHWGEDTTKDIERTGGEIGFELEPLPGKARRDGVVAGEIDVDDVVRARAAVLPAPGRREQEDPGGDGSEPARQDRLAADDG
jgi:hypothetical protein